MAESEPQPLRRVTGLNIFPIKSCHAVQVKEIQVDSYGVVDDRRFMLVDGNNRFVSQRKFSKLATVRPRFIAGAGGRKMLHVNAPGMDRDLCFAPVTSGERVEAGVWEDRVGVVDQGEEPAAWFSKFIGHGGSFMRLVSSAESPNPPQNDKTGGDNFNRVVSNLPPGLRGRLPPMQLALADAGPVSLVSTESLADVNRRLRERECEEVPCDRFRMNVEISGCSRAFEEDEWLLVRIGEVTFLAYTNAEVSKTAKLSDSA